MRTIPVLFFLFTPLLARADNVLHAGTPVVDRPTLMALGVQLPITGDDNYNAAVTVRYRQSGTTAWRTALPLFRVHPDTVYNYAVAPQFAGSIFDLRPDTSYEIELHAFDPDGPVDQILTLTAATRPVPGDPATPRARAATDTASLQSALSTAAAGDIITLSNGTYSGNSFSISNSGTAANPIVIRGASQDGVILDGGNCTGCNILEVYGSYIHVENLTMRNAERAMRFQNSGELGNVVRRVHIQNTTLGISGRSNQFDFYIADNILEGRLSWPLVYKDDNGLHSDDDGIQVTGFGMVIAHNRISGYGDAMKTQQSGARAVDVYGNDVLWTYDNAIELDESEGNARALRNRFTNCSTPLSVQPIYGGPAYILRNVVVNTVDEQIKFHALNVSNPPPEPNGVFAYHNTFLSPYTELQVQTPFPSHHFVLENNLFIGPTALPGYAVNWDAPIDDGTFDYNGYYPDGTFLFRWAATGYANYANFAAMQSAGVETHGTLLQGQIFANGMTAPTNYTIQTPPPDAALSGSGPAIDKGLVLPNVNDGFTGARPDLGALELGCPAPIYGPRPVGTDESNEPLGCSTAAPPTGAAIFLKTDTGAQGTWKPIYGADGANVIGDAASYPSYVTVAPSGNASYTWAGSTTDVRALQKTASSTDRVAACWYTANVLTINLNFTDANTHQVALYLVDFDNYHGRTEQVDILDANNTLLDTRTVSGFVAGQYLVWNLSGKLIIRITNTNAASNAVMSGLFFGGAAAPPPPGTATFLQADTATQGAWKGAYGAQGANVIGDSASYPAYVTVTPSGNSSYTWAASTTDVRALQKSASTDRVAACWYSASVLSADLNFADQNQHQVALYFLDFDNYHARTERVDILDGNNNLLDSRTLSAFTAGQYLVWNLSGRVIVRITNTNAASNAVVSGLFFDGAAGPPLTGTATFLNSDATSEGSWKGVYGADGVNVIGDSASYPAYVAVAPSGNAFYTWAGSTTDLRALQKAASTTDRVAACWYASASLAIDLRFTDANPHQVALYLMDFDNLGRTERVDILDGNNVVLDSRAVSAFTGGQYWAWNLSGRVVVRITNTNGSSNAVVSGLFFR